MSKVNPQFQMTSTRIRLISIGIFVYIVIALGEIFAESEHWPFCSYPMYSRIREDMGLTRLVMFGVADQPPYDEKPLLRYRYLYPFDAARLGKNLLQLEKMPAKDELFQRVLKNILHRYEKRRKKGIHDGPPLKAIKLYRVHWKLRPDLANLESPEQKVLIARYQPSESGDSQ